MRYFDVVDKSAPNKNAWIYYEFKSVAKVPPAHFAEQFLKDLQNADNLDQIKWIFDGKKLDNLPQDKFLKALESSKNKLFSNSKVRKMLEDELDFKFENADELMDALKNDTEWFNKIFTISGK